MPSLQSISIPHVYNDKNLEQYYKILTTVIECGGHFRRELKQLKPTHSDMYFLLIDFAIVDLEAYKTGEKRITCDHHGYHTGFISYIDRLNQVMQNYVKDVVDSKIACKYIPLVAINTRMHALHTNAYSITYRMQLHASRMTDSTHKAPHKTSS